MGDYVELEIRILKRYQGADRLYFPVEINLDGKQSLGRLDPEAFTEDMRHDGEALFRWLFQDSALRAAWGEARGRAPSRQVRLRIDAEEPKLHGLPWELLRDPGDGGREPQHIATHSATPFSRYLAGPWEPGGPVIERPVRILIAIANPSDASDYGLASLDVELEFAALERATRELPVDLSLVRPRATLTAIESALRRERPHILHIIAHGAFKDDQPYLFLVREDDKADFIPGSRFAATIGNLLGGGDSPLRLIYLGSCQTAVTSPADAFRGLGQRLIAAGVPAVFAMQDLVPIITNREFSAAFYERLFAHGLLDLAANEGRATLDTADTPGFAIPVLFNRLKGSRLLSFGRDGDAGLDAAHALLAQLPTDHVPDPDRDSLPPNSRPGLDLDPNFTGREDELKELARELKEGRAVTIGQPVVISGLGGMGKSSLASALLYRYGRYFAGGVFWLSFADPANIPSEIVEVGSRLNLPGFDGLDLPEKVAATRRAWEGPLPRLLVFDNCEEEKLIDQYKPIGGGCRVLVTSRSAAWDRARGLYTRNLQTLPRHDSIAFLRKLADRLNEDEADAIAKELGDFPLALHLAGSFLARYGRVGVSSYLDDLRRQSPLDHPSLQGRGVRYNPTRHELSVHKTFLVSLDRLDAADPVDGLARDLLLRAACFAPGEPIPDALLLSTLPAGTDVGSVSRLDAEDALQRLLMVGLLEPAGDSAVRLHRLLAVFVQLLGIDEATRIVVEKTVGDRVAEIGHNVAPAAFAAVLPHLRHAAAAALQRTEDPHSAWLCSWLASLLDTQGDYAAARPLLERALAIREQALGPDHPDTAQSLNNLAALLRAQGDYAAARPLYERALAIREQALGPDHPATATSLNNLAVLHYAQGDYAAARPLFERALAIYEQALGPDHPSTATSLNNLASLLDAQGDYAAARPLLERALAIREQALGPDHPDTAQSLNNLAYLLRAQGDYAAARPLYERALAIYEQALGPDHPDTATSLNNLAYLLRAQGDTAAARPLYERALAITEQVLGPDHPDTAQSLNNLASLLQDQGDTAAARPLYERALAIMEKSAGPDHPNTRVVRENLEALNAA